MRSDLPTGTVTFLFTDVEGSTRLLHELGADAYADALADHRRIVREACAAEDGVEVDTQGDAFFFAFPSAAGAVAAAGALTEELATGQIRVRVGLHTGTPLVTDEGYVGDDVHFAARVAATGHGGQVLLSKSARELVDGLLVTDLGEHRLKDIEDAVSIYQLGEESFPPLKTISNTNLPHPASSFVGRERELSEVLATFERGTRLLTLTGPGGSGKTRLAIEAAGTLVPSYKAGVFWVGLSSLREASLVTDQIAQTLGAKDGLADHIGEREMLLLLDNLEQVIDAAPALSGLVQACRHLTLFCTSRELLRVQGEVEYAVPPLTSSDAATLFCERSGLAISDEITELCARLDSLPLAVELAAARTKALSVSEILERLSQRLDLLRGGRDADPRQQTLRATIEWSYELLTAKEQLLFRRLAVFVGGCTLKAAEEVAEADLDTLQSLVEKNLVRFTPSETGSRYWMLQTIREFAAEQLEASSEADALYERLVPYLVDLAYANGAPTFRLKRAEAAERLDREYANVRAVMHWAHQKQRSREAAELVAACATVWLARDHATEASGWLPLALGAKTALPPEQWLLVLMGGVHLLLFGPEDLVQARLLMEEALVVCESVQGQEWLEAAVLSELAQISRHERKLGEATRWAQRSLDVRAAHGLETVGSLAELASIALADDDLDRAKELLVEVRDIFARDGPESNAAVASRQLGEVERRCGNIDAAIGHVTHAVLGFAKLGDKRTVGACLQDLARLVKARGQLERAAHLWAVGHALRGGVPDHNPLFSHDIGELPDLPPQVQVDVGLEEAVELALSDHPKTGPE